MAGFHNIPGSSFSYIDQIGENAEKVAPVPEYIPTTGPRICMPIRYIPRKYRRKDRLSAHPASYEVPTVFSLDPGRVTIVNPARYPERNLFGH